VQTQLQILDPSELAKLLDVLHDEWFDVDALDFDRSRSVLRIPFRDREDTQQQRSTNCLEIRNVDSYEVQDTEHVGFYDLNEIRYEPSQQRLTIVTGVPLGFTIQIRQFELVLNEIADSKRA
jgi:hypothetical protein